MHIRVDFKPGQLERDVKKWLRRQLPFAMTGAINDTAFDARIALVRDLPDSFTIRGPHTEKGMRVRKATKSAEPTAYVGNVHRYMKLQHKGGTKEAKSGMLGVPIAARPTPETKTTKSLWPSALAKKPRHFVAKLPSGRTAVYRRKTKKPYPLEVMYILRRSVKIEKGWPLDKIVRETVRRYWVENAKAAWKEAKRTARPPKRR